MPTTAPATPAKTAPSTQADTKPPAPDPTTFTDSFGHIDDLAESGTNGAKSETKATEPETKVAEVETKVEEPETKPRRSAGDDLDALLAKKPAATKSKEDGLPTTPKALREEYAKVKSELSTRDSRIKELEAAVTKAAADERKSVETALQAKLDALIKERDEYETQVRFLRFEESKEYRDKYKEPLNQAWKVAIEDIQGLKAGEGDEARDLNADDLFRVFNLPTGQARTMAEELFGKAASDVMRHRTRVRELTDAAKNASKEWREKGSQFQAQEQEAAAATRKALAEAIDGRVKELGEVAPELFGDKIEDKEEAAYVEKSRAIVEVALGRTAFKEGTSAEERARAIAKATGDVVARATHFARVLHQRNRYRDENESLKAKLAEYEKTEPETRQGDGEKTTKDALDFESQIDALADVSR